MGMRHDLPSTYYRVSLKALIFDEQQRLLVFQDETGKWELPGGGWEHRESMEDCLRRELTEEVGGIIETIETVPRCMYVDHEPPGYYKLSIACSVTLADGPIAPRGDELIAYQYVTREEFLHLSFQTSERSVVEAVDKIWSTD